MFVQTKTKMLSIWQSTLFSDTTIVQHGFSTRMGGVSPMPYDSLNLGLYNQDTLANVQENRKRFAYALGIAPEQAVCGQQVHQTKIQVVGKADCGRGYLKPDTAFPSTDGLITKEKGVALVTCFADCVPVLFLDTVQQVIGVCHCGWRGTVEGMAARTVQAMQQTFACCPQNILAVIGPSISLRHYEVDLPVLERVRNAFDFAEQCIKMIDMQHGYLDLWQLNQLQLKESGLLAEHIEISGLCTVENENQFFSHRASAGNTGRNAAILMLKE